MENKLVPIEHNGVRVITTELLAQVYETDTNNIKNNFNNHKDNFWEGVHYGHGHHRRRVFGSG